MNLDGTLFAILLTEMVSFEVILIALAACLFGAFVFQAVLLRAMRRELRAGKGRIEEASCRDDLTGLLNRRVFQEILGRELAHARRNDGCVGVAILDVDGLELINDGLGLNAGDEVLETLAKRLERLTRESDILARLGGDELAILIGKCESTTDVLTAIYRLRSIWQEPINVSDHELQVSCCVGLSVFPDDADGRTELLGHAGQALAKAKERGFDSLCVFDEFSDRQALARLEWQQELRRALERDEFELYIQPQISLRDGRLVGAEGLVRWRHPREGLLTAGHFVPLAEQLGLMPSLSRWVIKEMCSRSAEWLERGLPLVPLSVNVSVRHFQNGDVPATVAECLDETGLDARFLHLEVTESAALHDVELMTQQFERLKELGVGLQLDDFGTGYSSLSYLLRYPLDVIKIDRSFVQDLHLNEHSEAIVKATMAMARSLGLEVVAEGVETVEEYRRLVQLGCRTAQGFLFARPMPRDEFEKLVIAGRIELPGSQAA